MPDEITTAMVEAAIDEWAGDSFPQWRTLGRVFSDGLRKRMRRTLAAAIAAAPTAHGERG